MPMTETTPPESTKPGPTARDHRANRAFALILAAMALCSPPATAQSPPPNGNLAATAARRFPQPVQVATLIGRTVLQPIERQPVLGHVRAVVRQPDGTALIVIGYGGLLGSFGLRLGLGTRPIAVPADAMALLGANLEITAFTPAQLDKFPTWRPTGTTPIPPSRTISIPLAKPAH